ncbi:methyl-accepting chemotaxis protein [Methylobacterium sp. P31]
MPKFNMSVRVCRCVALGLVGGPLVAAAGWRLLSAAAHAPSEPTAAGGLTALTLAASGAGLLLTRRPGVEPSLAHPCDPAQHGLSCDEAGAIEAAVQVFEAGLVRMRAVEAETVDQPGTSAPQTDDVTGLLAAIAGQTSLMALRASLAAARSGEAGRGFAAAAAEVKDLAGQMARATDRVVSQVGLIQAAAARAQDTGCEASASHDAERAA